MQNFENIKAELAFFNIRFTYPCNTVQHVTSNQIGCLLGAAFSTQVAMPKSCLFVVVIPQRPVNI